MKLKKKDKNILISSLSVIGLGTILGTTTLAIVDQKKNEITENDNFISPKAFLGTNLTKEVVEELGWTQEEKISLSDWKKYAPNVTSIGGNDSFDAPFYNNKVLQSIEIPKTIESINYASFYAASSLKEVIFESDSHLDNIGDLAFSNSSIDSLNIPNSVNSIGQNAFRNTTFLAADNILISSKLKQNSENALYGFDQDKWDNINWDLLNNESNQPRIITSQTLRRSDAISLGWNTKSTITLNDWNTQAPNVEFIRPDEGPGVRLGTFQNFNNLTSIEIPAKISFFSKSIFEGTSNLRTITFQPNSKLTRIDQTSFKNSGITSIQLPELINNVGEFAFQGTSSLTTIKMPIGLQAKQLANYGLTDAQWGSIVWTGITGSVLDLQGVNALGWDVKASISNNDWLRWAPNVTQISPGGSSGSGPLAAFKNNTALRSIEIPSKVTSINYRSFEGASNLRTITFTDPINSKLTSIQGLAFQNTNLNSIDIPNSVTSIANNAFQGATGLSVIKMHISLRGNTPTTPKYGFTQAMWDRIEWKTPTYEGTTLTKDVVRYLGWDTKTTITASDWANYAPNVNEIGSDIATAPFANNTILQSIYIPDLIDSIREHSFRSATNLASVTFGSNSSLRTIDEAAFENSGLTIFNVPNSLRVINTLAFKGTSRLTEFSFSDSRVARIEESVFENSGLTSIYVPDSIESINTNAFKGTSALTTISISSSLRLGETPMYGFTQAQWNLINWRSVQFQGTVLTRNDVLQLGWNVKSVITENDWTTWAPNVTQIGSSSLPNGSKGPFEGISLSTIFIPAKVTALNASAFKLTTSLVSVTFGTNSQLTTIGNSVFENSFLSTISIPNRLATIGSLAFKGTKITSLNLPNSVTSIGTNAFEGTTSLLGPQISMSINLRGNPPTTTKYGFTVTQWNLIQWRPNPFTGTTLTKSDVVGLGWDIKTEITLQDWENFAPNVTSLSPVATSGNGDAAAFSNNTNLQSIVIPAKVTVLNYASFFNTTSLSTVSFEANSQLTSIAATAFRLSKLTSINIPSGVTTIGNNAFDGTTSMSTINFTSDSALTGIGQLAFQSSGINSIEIPRGVTTFANQVFRNTKSLGVVSFASNSRLSTIGTNAFRDSGITSIELPSSVTSIGQLSFSVTRRLTSLTFAPNSQLNTINGQFLAQSALRKINIPDSLVTVSGRAFELSGSVTDIEMSSKLKKGSLTAKYGFNQSQWNGIKWRIAPFEGATLTRGDVIDLNWHIATSITLNDWNSLASNVIKIGAPSGGADVAPFANNTSLRSIVIPDKVTEINSNAFQNASVLTTVTIGATSSLTTIGDQAFQGSKINGIFVPNSVTSIGSNAFQNTISLLGPQVSMQSTLRQGSQSPLYGFTQTQWDNIVWRIVPFEGTVLTRDVVVNLGWDEKSSITLDDWATFAPNIIAIGDSTLNEGASEDLSQAPFANNSVLTSIQIPSTILNINYGSFAYTTSLRTVTFSGTPQLQSIRRSAFEGSGITSITIPNSLTIIDRFAFNKTGALTTVNFSNNSVIETIGEGAFARSAITSINVPSTVTLIGDNAFQNTPALQGSSVSMLISLRKGSSSPLYGFTAAQWNTIVWRIIPHEGAVLTKEDVQRLGWDLKPIITQQDWAQNAPNVTQIGTDNVSEGPFSNNTILTSINIPSRITSIGVNSFAGATSLTSINIPNSVTSIGENAFQNTTALLGAQVSMQSTLRQGSELPLYGFTTTQWDSINWRIVPFEGTILLKSDVINLGWSKKTNITLFDWTTYASKVTSLGNFATSGNAPTAPFEQNSILQSIVIPARVTNINFGAFYLTSNLRSVTFQSGSQLTQIGNASFRGSGITSITVPNTVTTIGDFAFNNTSSLATINFEPSSQLSSISNNAFQNSAITSIDVPDSVTSIGSNAFVSTNSLQGPQISMPLRFKITETTQYGFTQLQWNGIVWRGTVNLSDTITTSFLVELQEGANIVQMPALKWKASSGMSSDAVLAGLGLQYAIGAAESNLIIEWGTFEQVKAAITSYSASQDILKSDLNIYARMYLPNGTGPENNMIGSIRYEWDKTSQKIYDNTSGTIANLFTPVGGTSASVQAGKFIRTYSKIENNWANPLSAEGQKSSEVKIQNRNNAFDMVYYTNRGIQLEVSSDAGTTWKTITTFNSDVFNASATNKVQFRLSVVNAQLYEIYGPIQTTTPTGTMTTVVEKDIIAKKELPGINANNLVSDKLSVSGSTHNLVITENPELYTASGMPIVTAKTFFKIQYTYDGTRWYEAAEFTSILNALRKDELNNLNLDNFKVKYEFTTLGLETYFSTQVSNDPDADPSLTIKTLVTTNVKKTLDLSTYISNVASVNLSGTSLNIQYANELDTTSLTALGVKIQWSYWELNSVGNIVRSPWVEEKPTSVAVLNYTPNPNGFHPIAIRFVKLNESNEEIELKTINNNVAADTDTTKGYAPNVSGLRELVRFDEVLGTNYKASGIMGNVVSMNVIVDKIDVSSLASEMLEMQFAIGASQTDLKIEWTKATDLKRVIAAYNLTRDILKSELNIYMKLVLKNGTGADSNVIDGVEYIWDKQVAEVYNNNTGLNADFAIGVSGSKLRAYSKVEADWANPLSAEGQKSSAVKIQNQNNIFRIDYWEARGVKLEVSPNGGANWTAISQFNSTEFDASQTSKMQFRLNVIDASLYEIYGTIAATNPTGTKTPVIEKDVIAKIELSGIRSNDLISNKLVISGTTHNLLINESDDLYTSSGLSITEAKRYLEIKYSFDGSNYLSKNEFITALSALRNTELNNLELANFKVRYEFTAEGLNKYFSTEVANDPDALESSTKILNTSSVIKIIDLNEYIQNVANVVLSGTTLAITYANELDTVKLATWGVKIQWSYWTNDSSGEIIRSEWVDEKPTRISILNNPNNPNGFYPIAIRFVKINSSDAKTQLKNIVGNSANDIDSDKGYRPNIAGLNEIVEFSELLGTNYKISGIAGNVLSMDATEVQINVSTLASEMLEMQFAIGPSNTNLVINWSNATDFKAAIVNLYRTRDILKTQLNIYVKLILKGGTGPGLDTVGEVKYKWDNNVVEVYNNETGLSDQYAQGTAGSKLRAYSKVETNWADSLSAEGNKSTEVKILSLNDVFNIDFYTQRGVKLEVNPGAGADWVRITEFNTDILNASTTNKMQFRLSVIDSQLYEIYGAISTITPVPGTETEIVEKDIIAKIELPGILASNLVSDKLTISGTTHNIVIVENPELYTASGLDIVTAKTFFEIKYSFNGTSYWNLNDFTNNLNKLRGQDLNNLDLSLFKVRYEFTTLGLAKYYSSEVFNDPDAVPSNTIRPLNTTGVTKTIDVTSQIADIERIRIVGSTENITWSNMGSIPSIATHVKIEYGTYVRASDGTFTYSWSEIQPTSIISATVPEGGTNFPIAMRFMPKSASDKVEIGSIDGQAGIFNPSNTDKGYEIDVNKLVTIINIDTTELVNKLIFTGYATNLNGGASSSEMEMDALGIVDAFFRDEVEIKYEISILPPGQFVSLDQLKQAMLNYANNYTNSTSGIMIFSNATIPGVTIKAKFVPKDPAKFTVVSSPTETVELNTSGIKTNVDLKQYVEVLKTQKVIPSGTSSSELGKLTMPSMPAGNVQFSGRTYEQIEAILSSSIDIEFKAPGFHGDAWMPLSSITSINVDNELFIRFNVKEAARGNIELSLVTDNDYLEHLANGFKLKIALPIEIQVNPANLINSVLLSGSTRDLILNDDKVYTDLVEVNPDYLGKVKILYTIGKTPMALDPTQPSKTEFTKSEIVALLKLNKIDITDSDMQITGRYALADGISTDDYIIKDESPAVLNVTNVLLFINKSNYYEIASTLKVSGDSSSIIWGRELNDLINILSKGLTLQYSVDNTVSANDPTSDPRWTTIRPTTISANEKFLAVRLVTNEGYIFEEAIRLFNVDTSNVLLIIELQTSWLDSIAITGNTRNLEIDLTAFELMLTNQNVPGKEFIHIQYFFGGTVPSGLGIPSGTEWFSAEQIKSIFLRLKGAKNEKELILFRNTIKARYTLTNEGFKTYRLNINGSPTDEQFPSQPSFYRDLVTPTVNAGFKGYINLDLVNKFIPDSFQVVGSDKKPELVTADSLALMLDFYKNQTTVPFDIYYTNTENDFSNTNYKLFGENGFIETFHPGFIIKLDEDGKALPIWFKMVARPGYEIWESETILSNGKVIEVSNFNIQPQITNPLTSPPDIRFTAADGSKFYQGSGSLSVYVSGTNVLVDSTYLNREYPDVRPYVLKLQYNVHDSIYTPEELEAVKLDQSKWSDDAPTDLRVGQYVMARVAINNPIFQLTGGDAMTLQTRVSGLRVHADQLNVDPSLILTNTDIYGYTALDGQAKIEVAKILADPVGNYLGADLQMSVETEFHRDASGRILVDVNGNPLVLRNPEGATTTGNYKDANGREIIDGNGRPIPIWTIERGGSIIPAPPLRTGIWKPAMRMSDWSVEGSFSQEDTGNLEWRLFEGQFVKFSFIPRIGNGSAINPDFYFDDTTPITPEIELSNIKYAIQTNGIDYRFDQNQLKDITYVSDEGDDIPYTGSSHISSLLTAIKILPNNDEQILSGLQIEEMVKKDFNDLVQIKMQLNKKNGTSEIAYGSDISQFNGLQNGDIITIGFESKDSNFSLPKPITPLTIIVQNLFIRPLDKEIFKHLRPNFTGSLNGSGAFNIRVTVPNNPTDTNETILGNDQWYEYQVWHADKTLKTEWTRDESRINNLVNGDKIEWKLVNREGVFEDDYYNTLLANTDTEDGITFKVVNVDGKNEQTFQDGIGSSQKINPNNPDGTPQYPEDSGWIVSGLKVEITLDPIQQEKFELALKEFKPTFSGVDKFGSMSSNISNDISISKEVVIAWYARGNDGVPRKITDFREARLSNGDEVWATIAPSQYAIENNLIIDESISSMSSERFIVSGLTVIVNSTTQTLIISLITASSVLLVGITGAVMFAKRNSKIKGNRRF